MDEPWEEYITVTKYRTDMQNLIDTLNNLAKEVIYLAKKVTQQEVAIKKMQENMMLMLKTDEALYKGYEQLKSAIVEMKLGDVVGSETIH